MFRGKMSEAYLVQWFRKQNKLRCRRPKSTLDPDFAISTEQYGFPMNCILDARTVDSTGDAAIEVKTGSHWVAHEWLYEDGEDDSANDKMPLHYYLQTQHQLAVTGWEHCYVPAEIGGQYVQRLVRRDDAVIEMLVEKERYFWVVNVQGHEPPETDGSAGTTEAISRRWPRSTPEAVDVVNDPEVERLAATYQQQGSLLTNMKKERDAVGNRLRVLLKDREALLAGGYKVTWKSYAKKQFDLDAFRAAHPAIAEEFTVEKTQRPLKVTETKEG
jgi:predicted phage-related endonuclease